MKKVLKYQNSPERLWNFYLGDAQNSAGSHFVVGFALSKWLEKTISKGLFQPKPLLCLSAQKTLMGN